MFNRRYDAAFGTDDGGQAGVYDVIEMGGNPGVAGKICADKSDAVVDRCRLDGEANGFPRMYADTGTACRRVDGLLVVFHFTDLNHPFFF
jgi:hypothetical protein